MVVTREITVQTKGQCDIINITGEVNREVRTSPVVSGLVTVFVAGSTAGVTTIEYEDGALADFKGMWERLVPAGMRYAHDQAWEDGNGYSHIRAALLGPSLTVPFSGGRMALGTWQQIVLIDFDNRPRSRQVVLQITGDGESEKV